MTYARRRLERATPEKDKAIRAIMAGILRDAICEGMEQLGSDSSVAVVCIAIGMMAEDLGSLDGESAANFFFALSDLVDPGVSLEGKNLAEHLKGEAIESMANAAELYAAEVSGRA